MLCSPKWWEWWSLLLLFPASQVCLGFQLDMTPGRQREARSSRLSPSLSRKSGRSFLFLPHPARNCKAREWHRIICANSMQANLLHSVLVFFHSCRRNIEESWWGAAPDTPYIFFYLYKNITLLRSLRIFWRPRTVFQPLAVPSNIRDCSEEFRLPVGIFCPSLPMRWVERSRTDWDGLPACPAFSLLTARRSSIWPGTEPVILSWMCLAAQTCKATLGPVIQDWDIGI